jgi:predicted secreted protein
MTIQKNIIVIMVFILLGNFCAEAADKLNNMDREVMLDTNSNGKQVEVRIGDEINIELVGAGGTGYWWYFDKLDRNFFEFVGEETRLAGKGEKEVTGGPIIGTWKLRAKKAGRSIIRMKYYRAWEKSSGAINQFEVSVDIRP